MSPVEAEAMSVRAPTHDELAAKWAITEVIHRYCRGLDRIDGRGRLR